MLPSIVSVTSGQLAAWTAALLWPFVRILALVSTAPVLGDPVVPRQVKVALSALLAVALAPELAVAPSVPIVSVSGVWLVVQQVLVGIAMGFTMRLVFVAVQAAGEYIGLQMGLSFASFYDASAGGQAVVIAQFLNLLAMLIFLALDGHLLMIATLARSFDAVPVADVALAAGGWMTLVRGAGGIFTTGLMLALPLVTALLILNLAMGILNRASPQFSIFAVGFPITLLGGIGMLSLLMPRLAAFLDPRFGAALDEVQAVLRALAPR
jgi:flagellar biosynthesis protein FliR